MARLITFLSVFFVCISALRADPFFKDGDRVLFLGDSITADGRYVAFLDLLLRTRLPDRKIETMPCGLPSETVSGLSEAHHPWPRPSVMERLGRALEKAKPTVVVACYGMNDGIYAPYADERLAAYEKAYRELSRQVHAAGARLVILTPPPFDAASFGGKLLPADGADFGYMTPFQDYNATLARYAAWLLSTTDLADKVVDLHGPVSGFLREYRRIQPDWKNGDGVHPSVTQHWIMAAVAAEGLGIPAQPAKVTLSKPDEAGAITVTLDGGLPLPVDASVPEGALDAGGFRRRVNDLTLLVKDNPSAVLSLSEGDHLLGILTRAELAKGADLTARAGLSLNREAWPLLDLALQRHQILGPAWREHVGHQRPSTDRRCLPLEEAKAKAAEIEAKIATAAKPRQTVLKLAQVK